MKECCGRCKFNEYGDDEFVCTNEESEAYGCETIWNEGCESFEAEEEDEY